MKKILKIVLKTVGGIIAILGLYVLLAYLLPHIEVPAEKTNDPKTVDVYLLTNGVHTDIVVPVKNNIYDWNPIIPMENTLSKRTDFKYLSVGWGDKGFYMDTPTWADLKFSTAFKAAFWLSKSAMHCTFYDTMKEGDDCVKITISTQQYENLVKYINAKFDHDPSGKVVFIPTNAVYGKNDSFYDANGSYSFLYTCNSWANNALKSAGQKSALWSPTDFGIFQHYKK